MVLGAEDGGGYAQGAFQACACAGQVALGLKHAGKLVQGGGEPETLVTAELLFDRDGLLEA